MAIKTFLILLSLISYPSVSGAEIQDLQKYSLMQKKYQMFSQEKSPESSNISESVNSLFLSNQAQFLLKKPLNSLSPTWAFFLVSLPLTSSFLVGVVEASIGKTEYAITSMYAITAMTFLTIPAHNYVHDSFSKTLTITLIKTSFLILLPFGFGTEAINNKDDNFIPNSKETTNNSFFEVLFAGMACGFIGVYIYELYDIPSIAKKYNEGSEIRRGLYLQPLAGPREYRLNLGYRF